MKTVIKALVVAMGMYASVGSAVAAGDDDTVLSGGQPVYDLLVTENGKEVTSLRVSPMMGLAAEQADIEAVPYVKSSTYDAESKKSISENAEINTGVTFRVTPSFPGDDSIYSTFHISNVVLKKMHSVSDEHGNKVDLPESTETIFEATHSDDLETLRKNDSVVWTSTSNGLTYTVSLHLM